MTSNQKPLKLLPPTRISCGYQFTLAASDSGLLYAWGDNRNGKLGLGFGAENIWSPSKVESDSLTGKVNEISCGFEFSLCIITDHADNSTEAGSLLAWGLNTYGQLGVFDEKNVFEVNVSLVFDRFLIIQV